jgi:hypothetical protein
MAGDYGCQARVRQDGERTSPLRIFRLRFAFRFARLAPARNSSVPTWPKAKFWVRDLAACRTETLRLNAEGDFAVVGFRLALDRTLIPV